MCQLLLIPHAQEFVPLFPVSTLQKGSIMRLRLATPFLLAIALTFTAAAHAQDLNARIKAMVAPYAPLTFKAEASEEVGAFTNLSNAVFKPKGEGPFPAVVLVHTCGGIKDAHMRRHARELLEKNFVVLMQDSFEPRGMRDCGSNNQNAVSAVLGVSDAYAALAHLKKYPFVDKDRIYQSGYSWGGFVATLLSSSGLAEIFNAPARFRATVSNYSPCVFQGRELITKNADKPVLMLMGDKDTETPASSCFPKLEELKAAGKPVHWHVFPDTTHGWDKEGQMDRGYFYNEAISAEATRRMIAFFDENK